MYINIDYYMLIAIHIELYVKFMEIWNTYQKCKYIYKIRFLMETDGRGYIC